MYRIELDTLGMNNTLTKSGKSNGLRGGGSESGTKAVAWVRPFSVCIHTLFSGANSCPHFPNPLKEVFQRMTVHEKERERGTRQTTVAEGATSGGLGDRTEPVFRHPGASTDHPDILPTVSWFVFIIISV